MSCKLTGLSLHLAILSLSAIGGGVVLVAPDVHDYVAVQNHWLTSEEFAAVYALAQAAPGPNVLFVTLVGWLVAGMKGALATTAAVIVPSSLLALGAARLAKRARAGGQRGQGGQADRSGEDGQNDRGGQCGQDGQCSQDGQDGQCGDGRHSGPSAQDGRGGAGEARASRWTKALRAAIAPLSAGMLAAAGWGFLSMANAGALAISLALAVAVVVYVTKINPVWLVALGALAGLAGVV